MNTKQVIIIREDLKMRRGKEIAQASHASLAFLTQHGSMFHDVEYGGYGSEYHDYGFKNDHVDMKKYYEEIQHWLTHSFRKIVCCVDLEEEIVQLHQKALESGLMSHLITDNGLTEFNGVPTITALAIGPHWDERFTDLTSQLQLY
jgi:peptidyl-tRNA hydrolase, PTH2 family